MAERGSGSSDVVKLCAMGATGVGKSHLLNTYAFGPSSSLATPPTLGVDFFVCRYKPHSCVRVQVYDTSGAEKYYALCGAYFRTAHILLLCYDLCVSEHLSMRQLRSQYDYVIDNDLQHKTLCVVGCKADIAMPLAQVSVPQWCSERGLAHHITSAKDNVNVAPAIDSIIALHMAREREYRSAAGHTTITLGEAAPPATGCCLST